MNDQATDPYWARVLVSMCVCVRILTPAFRWRLETWPEEPNLATLPSLP